MSSEGDANGEPFVNTKCSPAKSKSVEFCFLDDEPARDGDDAEITALVPPKSTKNITSSRTNANTSTNSSSESQATSSIMNNLDEPITFLVEIAGITLPRDKSSANKWMDLGDTTTLNPRGMHCTACWIDKRPKSNGGVRKENVLHRTKTMRVNGSTGVDVTISASESSDDSSSTNTSSMEDEAKNREHTLTIDDSSLFLFKTSMKQLLDAQAMYSSNDSEKAEEPDRTNVANHGGIRFDIFEKPIDALSSIYRSVLAESSREKEDNATDDTFAYSSKTFNLASYNASYRLVGSVFLTPQDILSRCDAERFECDLVNGLRKEQRSQNGKYCERKPIYGTGNGGKLALRIRQASEFDCSFIRTLRHCDVSNIPLTVEMLNNAVRQNDSTRKQLKPVTITTEFDEKEVAAQASLKAIGNFSPQAFESVRYLFSDDTEPRVIVKPYPDPERVEETQWFTEEELHRECWKESTNWIKAGSGTLGKVYVEVLQCRDLPNVDSGVGNLTDAFVSIVYGDVMVQTDVIDDSLSPMWMPWTKRAYVFNMSHPSTAMYVGVVDYDVGPLEHECIGRAAIQLNKFSPGMIYTLSYKLYETSNLTDRGGAAGIITLRLRVEYDEKRYLLEGWKAPPSPQHVNSQQWKSHRVAKFCCDGPHDEEVFEMSVFRSHINEIMTAKRTLTYVISDALNSIIFWRAQVKVGNAWLPLHSAIVFYFSICLVERPQLLPSYICFSFGWIMMANMFQRENHPNPWRRGHSFRYYWNILISGHSFYSPMSIAPLEGHKEAVRYEKLWQDRLDDDDARWAKQAELDAKVKDISDESIIRTKAKANAPIADPISSLAGARLLPYQQRLVGYCKTIRYVRNVLNWSESAIAFRLTLICFGFGAVALLIPWAFLLKWVLRIVVWTFLGPWMKLADVYFHGLTLEEELKRSKAKSADELQNTFKLQCQAAKILRENTLKLKAFRVRLFGQFITKLPDFELSRHEDIPLPESSAEPYDGADTVEAKLFVPGQNLCGVMIPRTGEINAISEAVAHEKRSLVERFNSLAEKQMEGQISDGTIHENFELVSSKDQIVCVRSSNSVENDSKARIIKRLSSRTIQSALDNHRTEIQDVKQSQSKWVFTASIHLSLTKEAAKENEDRSVPMIEDDRHGKKRIQGNELAIEEEGVEIVSCPLCEGTESSRDRDLNGCEENEHISMLYVKDDGCRMADID